MHQTHQLIALSDATVQELQLELIRRTKFNAFNGQQVFESLITHRALWTATFLDRPGASPRYGSALLLIGGLIKLRDLPANIWNADTLYVLTPSPEAARDLARVIESENWGGEPIVYSDREEIDSALGTSEPVYGLLTVWWD